MKYIKVRWVRHRENWYSLIIGKQDNKSIAVVIRIGGKWTFCGDKFPTLRAAKSAAEQACGVVEG